jgi:hypothetical protein
MHNLFALRVERRKKCRSTPRPRSASMTASGRKKFRAVAS